MKQGLLHFTDIYLTSFGLIIFFCFFMSVIFITSKAKNKQLYKRLEHLPFGEHHE